MSEFVEIAFWLFVFVALALRNVANRAKQGGQAESRSLPELDEAMRGEALPAPHDARSAGDLRDRAESERQMAAARRRAASEERARAREREREVRSRAREREREVRFGPRARESREADARKSRKRRSLMGDWADLAREIERQMQEAAEGGRTRPEEDRTVVVPGRRIEPIESPPPGALRAPEVPRAGGRFVRRRREEIPTVRRTPLRSDEVARVERPRGGGLDRLDRYDPLKRAVILAEILGPPPGLGEGGPPLGRWDPGGDAR